MSFTAPEDAFLDVNDAHLRVYGNVHADGLKLGQLEVVTTTSTGSTINFLHQHTAFTTTSNIDVGTTNHDLFVDTNASRVGILTNTPGKTLDVAGEIRGTFLHGDGSNITNITSSQWTTVNSNEIHYAGNVGVGVTDPAFKLDVDGDINFTGTLREDGNPFVSTPWTIESGPTALSYTGGNVGIGAGTPSAKLEVTGNAHVSTDLSVGGNLTINTISAAATHGLGAVTALSNTTAETILLTNTGTSLVTSGDVKLSGSWSSGDYHRIIGHNTAKQIQFNYDDGMWISDNNSIRFGCGGTQGSSGLYEERMRITDDGKIGVGGRAPMTNLDIKCSVAQPSLVFSDPSNSRYQTGIGSVHVSGGGQRMDFYTGDSLTNGTLLTNSYIRMSIKHDGKLGIGETSPAELVHIRGSGPHLLIEGASNENAKIDFSSGPSYRNRRHQIDARFYALSGNGYRNWLAFRVNEGGENTPKTRMAIRGDGRVCIGEDHTIALAQLDIQDGARSGTSPSHAMAFYITQNVGNGGPGPEFRHPNQTQGLGLGYNTIYATGSNATQEINIVSRGTASTLIKNYQAYSDDRLKTNEQYITNATETLLKLKPQIYDRHEKINEICDNPKREAGLIAQDVYYDAPELRFLVSARNEGIDDGPVSMPEEKPFVDDDPTKDPDYSGWGNASASIAYIQLVPYLVKTIQELHERIAALENA